MLTLVATLSAHSARRIFEVGALVGLVGGVALAAGVLPSLRRFSPVVAGVLVAVGFALIIYAVHFGKTF
jgi:hypothetical protein